MLGEDLIRQINQALREGIQSSQRLVNVMKSQEEVDSIKEGLSATVINMNGLRRNHAAIDADVLEAFRTLVQDIRNFNDFNHAVLIPITQEVDDILAGVPFHAQTTHHDTHHDLGAPLLSGGASDYHHPHYQTMTTHNNDTHVVGAAAHQDSGGCCCSCVLM
jgi:hypothetical protein